LISRRIRISAEIKFIISLLRNFKLLLLSVPAHVREGCRGNSSRLSRHHFQHFTWLKPQASEMLAVVADSDVLSQNENHRS